MTQQSKKILLWDLGKIWLNKTKFGLHSLRSRGVTVAANLELNGGLFQKHGRWRSENVKNG